MRGIRKIFLEYGAHAVLCGCYLALGMLLLMGGTVQAQQKTFTLRGASLVLDDATPDVDVFFTSMRFNRISNVWNFEVTLTNHSARQLSGPILLSIDSFTGTSGPLLPDGMDDSSKAFYDLSANVSNGNLAPNARSAPRTLSLGFSGSAPRLVTRVFVRPSILPAALGLTRTLDEAGQPLPDARVIETGPNGTITNRTDPVFGAVTLGQATGLHTWQFSSPGRLSVWRQLTLTTNEVSVIANPRLVVRATNAFNLTPIAGGQLTNAESSMQISFAPGSVLQATTAILTPLCGQTLPAFLPLGWSPLQAFWLELGSEPTSAGTASLVLLDKLSRGETAALVRWNTAAVRWDVVQVFAGDGSAGVSAGIPGSGAYAVVVPDIVPVAPPAPIAGAALAGASVSSTDPSALTAGGNVQPPTSPANRVPDQVTATATVTITNATGPMSSGLVLRGDVHEQYRLRDAFAGLPPGALGLRRTPPQYENFLAAYQRPGVLNSSTLQAQFPLRPLLLFGAEELDQATVTMDVSTSAAFAGGVLDTNGGLIASQGVGVLAGAGDIGGRQAAQIRLLDATNFVDFATNNLATIAGFELTISGVTPGHHLVTQWGAVPTNSLFVVSRVLYDQGLYGLQPVERLSSDSIGRLSSAEPATGERLPGITGAGQYLLLQVPTPQGLVSGTAHNSTGQAAAGMPAQVSGQPWLAFSSVNGAFQLLAPTGSVQVALTDLTSGDTATAGLTITNPGVVTSANLSTISVGPVVVSVNPTNGASGVPTVSAVSVLFSKPLNPASLLNGGLQLLGSNNVPVAGSLSLNLRGTEASFLPLNPLSDGTVYVLSLSSNITDTGGLSLQGPRLFTFATAESVARPEAAVLTIFQPGSTNIPPDILNQLVGYDPTNNQDLVVAFGAPGTAEGSVPVILVNENSGRTTTVLSKSDGSFFGFIQADEADLLSAIFVNRNGTFNRIPASQQKFDDGTVGLFATGGKLETDNSIGTVQVEVKPNAIPTRVKFKITPVESGEIDAELQGTVPDGAQIVPFGIRATVDGTISGETVVSIPVDPAKLALPPDTRPEDGAYVLAVVREVDGVKAFEVIDKLRFSTNEFGQPRLVSSTFPIFLALAAHDILNNVIIPLVLGNLPFTVSGRTYRCVADVKQNPADTSQDGFCSSDMFAGLNPERVMEFEVVSSFFDPSFGLISGAIPALQDALIQISAKPLSGALVTLRGGSSSSLIGRVTPGLVYATSDSAGKFSLVGYAASAPFVLQGMHPLFAERPTQPVLAPLEIGVVANPGTVAKSLIFITPLASLRSPPKFTISHDPPHPTPTNTVTVTVTTAKTDQPPSVLLKKDSLVSLNAAQPASLDQVKLTPLSAPVVDGSLLHYTAQLTCTNEARVKLRLQILPTGTSALDDLNAVSTFYFVTFSLNGLGAPDTLKPSDTNDLVGPVLERVDPVEGEILPFGNPVVLQFNEAIHSGITNFADLLAAVPALGSPGQLQPVLPTMDLSPDQRVLTLRYPNLAPGTQYTVTIGGFLTDLQGNSFDGDVTQSGSQTKTISFQTPPQPTTPLASVHSGGGVAFLRSYMFVLERQTGNSSVHVFDVSDPTQPAELTDARITLPGFPRDLVVITNYSYVAGSASNPPVTNDLLAVVGGDLGTSDVDTIGSGAVGATSISFPGQYLRIFNISDPRHPQRVVSPIITLRPTAVTKIEWAPPSLVYLETGSDLQAVSYVDLQEFLLGFTLSTADLAALPFIGTNGVDANHDGDYVDFAQGDKLPVLSRVPLEFFGKKRSYVVLDSNQEIVDFAVNSKFSYLGAVLGRGFALDKFGQPTSTDLPPAYVTFQLSDREVIPPGTVQFPGARPKRVFVLPDTVPIDVAGVIQERLLAIVSLAPNAAGKPALAILDVSIGDTPQRINEILLPKAFEGSLPQSIQLRPDGLLALATSQDVLLLDPAKLTLPAPTGDAPHPAFVNLVSGAGSGNISLDSTAYGLWGVALGGQDQLINSGPVVSIVQFLGTNAMKTVADLKADSASLKGELQAMRLPDKLVPSRFRAVGGAVSTLDPPSPQTHYRVLVRAPGTATSIQVGLQSLNRGGSSLRNKGMNFPPVQSLTAKTQASIKQEPRQDCDAPIAPLEAVRLSDDPNNELYTYFLTKPFALTYEKMSVAELKQLKNNLDREILWSGFFLRAFIERQDQPNTSVGPFEAEVNTGSQRVIPRAFATLETLPGFYIMGPNPPGPAGEVKVPGTFGTISAHNGEFRHSALDLALPGRRLPIVFQRKMGGQDTYEGPFGRGWDFNYNQQVIYLRPDLFQPGAKMPLIVRQLLAQNTTAGSGDLILQNGAGRNIVFKNKGSTIPDPEIAQDPLVIDLGWKDNTSEYFLPDPSEAGVFDLVFKFTDGKFARLTPDGTQFWYSSSGRLEKIYHRYIKNVQELSYNQKDELTKIVDKSIDNDARFLEVGYFRVAGDPDLRSGLDDVAPNPFAVGKIARLRDYVGRDVKFVYNEEGLLEQRLGPEGSGINGGVPGRPKTVYLWDGNCGFSGIVNGGATDQNSQEQKGPLLSASVNNEGVIQGQGQSAAGPISVAPPANNSAATVDGSQTTALSADGTQTKITFDQLGYPKSIEESGPKAAKAVYTPVYQNGLLVMETFPEGNSVEYIYSTNAPVFRARGNLTQIKRHPGSRGGQETSEQAAPYDLKYNLPSGTAINANGKNVTYTLTSDARDIASIQYEGTPKAQAYGYSDYGQLVHEETPSGKITDYIPDQTSGFMDKEIRNGVQPYVFGYDGSVAAKLGLPTSVTMPRGASPLTARYDNRLLLTHYERGQLKVDIGYDANGNPIHIQRALGGGALYEETREYDQVNFLKKVIVQNLEIDGNAGPLEIDFTPDSALRIQKIQYPNTSSVYEYDHLGNVTKLTVGGSYVEEYGHDLNGNLTSVTKNGSLVRGYGYDGYDRLVNFTNMVGAIGPETTSIGYFGNGERQTYAVSDSFGTELSLQITDVDGLGRPTIETRQASSAGPAQIKYTYQASSGGSVQLDGPRDQTTFSYDPAGRLVGQNDSVVTATFSPNGNGGIERVDSSEDNRTYSSIFGYDELDFLNSHADGEGTFLTPTPRLDGANTTIADGLGNTISQDFSVLGERTGVTRPKQIKSVFKHDATRQPTYIGDPVSGNTMKYDTTLRRTEKDLPNGQSSLFNSPNALNLPTSISLPGGNALADYDLQGRLTLYDTSYSPGDPYKITNGKYDAFGRLRSVSYGSVGQYSAVLGYDLLGPQNSASYNEALGAFQITDTLYQDGTRNTCAYPSHIQVVEERQPSGRLSRISAGGTELAHIQDYDGVTEPKTVLLGNGTITEQNIYDGRRRLAARRYTLSGNGTLLADVRYQYDLANNVKVRQQVHRHGRADAFTYDEANRLIHADVGLRPLIAGAVRTDSTGLQVPAGLAFAPGLYARSYGYDANGFDLLETISSFTPDPLVLPRPPPFASAISHDTGFRHPQTADGFTRSQDPLGNTTRTVLQVRTNGLTGPVPIPATLTYNPLSQLVKVQRDDGVTIAYEYRPDGLMHHRTVSDQSGVVSERGFVYHHGRLLEEYERNAGSTDLRARYYYRDEDSPFAVEFVSFQTTNLFFYLRDALGSVMAVANSSGQVVERANYDAWGQPELQARDSAPPRVSAIFAAPNNELLVEFTETVMPPLIGAGPGKDLVTQTADLTSAFHLAGSNGPILLASPVYEEDLPTGFPFGALVRLRPQGTVPTNLVLTVTGGALVDEWGVTNVGEQISFSLGGTNAVLFQGSLAFGATAPQRFARSSIDNWFLFQGQFFDYDTGLCYLRARFYDPSIGHFLQRDPLEYQSSVNLYAGLGNNPASRRDPTGAGPEDTTLPGVRIRAGRVRAIPPPPPTQGGRQIEIEIHAPSSRKGRVNRPGEPAETPTVVVDDRKLPGARVGREAPADQGPDRIDKSNLIRDESPLEPGELWVDPAAFEAQQTQPDIRLASTIAEAKAPHPFDGLEPIQQAEHWAIYKGKDGKARIRFKAEEAITAQAAKPGRNYTGGTEARLTPDGRVFVEEGRHRAIGAAHGDIIPEWAGGVPEHPGWLDYAFDPWDYGPYKEGGLRVRDLKIDYDLPEAHVPEELNLLPPRNK